MPFKNDDGRIRGAKGVELRKAFLSKNPLCKRCDLMGITKAAEEVDHVKPLSQGGEDVEANKQSLCKACHRLKTDTEEQARSTRGQLFPDWLEPANCALTIVFGPPGSGKSTYVRSAAYPSDCIVDLDEIKANITGLPIYHGSSDVLDSCIRERNRMLGELKRSATPTWFIATGAGKAERQWWVDKLKPSNVVLLKPSPQECIARIKADARRPKDVQNRHIKVVRDWYLAEVRGWKIVSPMGFDEHGNPLNPRHHGNG